HIKKNELRPWKIQRFCIPERDLARFISQMEVVLDLYSQLLACQALNVAINNVFSCALAPPKQ
ncbi:MAG: hypothetical protein RMY62_013525, partial [Nostoc sp. ZfuVER08]|nr:hypothetical protein [Nostoc sp. ZfuVER08]